MTVAVQQPQREHEKDPLDIIQQALGIATGIYGVALDRDKTNAMIEQNRLKGLEEKRARDLADEDRQMNIDRDFSEVKEGTEGAFKLPQRPGFFLPRSEIARREKLDLEKKTAKSDDSKKPQKLTAAAAGEVGDMQAVDKMIDNLESQYNEAASSRGSGILSLAPGSKSAKYLQNKKIATQAIGVILEKGKMTDGDRAFYNSMMPDPWDNNETAKAKIQSLRDYAKAKRDAQISGLKQGGFDVSNIEAPQAETKTGLSPLAEAAIAEKQRREALKGTAGK